MRHAWRIYLMPLILILVALNQQVLVRSHDLTPWKGGGFGMFATVDSRSARFVRVYLLNPEAEIAVDVPKAYKDLEWRVRSLPTEANLKALAKALAEETWVPARLDPLDSYVVNDNEPHLADTPPREEIALEALSYDQAFRILTDYEAAPTQALSFRGLRAELWQFTFDPETVELKASRKVKVIVPNSTLLKEAS